jgi:hypothetical protein
MGYGLHAPLVAIGVPLDHAIWQASGLSMKALWLWAWR